MPTEFVIHADHSTNIELVLYDALISQLKYHAEIDFWNVAGGTAWSRLPKEVACNLNPKYSTFCIHASKGVGFNPGLGWEITQLKLQHGQDAAINVAVSSPSPQ